MAEVFDIAALSRALEKASDDIKRDVSPLILQAADATRARVQAAYPVGPTGNLRRMVTVSQHRAFITTSGGAIVPARQVRASAPHVFIYQEGTRERFDATRKNARRGRSPRHGRIFEAIAASERARMLAEAQRIVDRPREL